MAAALVIVALAGGWLLVTRRGTSTAAPPASPGRSSAAPPTTEAASSLVPPTLVLGGVRVETRRVRPVNAIEAYEAAAGVRVMARRGPPACARGLADERAWSRQAAPTITVGRYRCMLEHGRAAMWWTDDRGLVAHAVAEHADLARLFTWWRAHLDP